MALDFRTVAVNFDPSTGAQRENGTAVFNSTVRRANAAIRGFNMSFADSDHRIRSQEIDINSVRIDGNTVSFNVDFNLRDDTPTDDPFGGSVEVVVMADVA